MHNLLKCRMFKIFSHKSHSVTYYTSSLNHESFLNGSSCNYLEEMYRLWESDPRQVHASWDVYFRNVKGGQQPGEAYISPPPFNITVSRGTPSAAVPTSPGATQTTTEESLNEETIKEYLVIQRLIASFRLRGHLAATLDPLCIVRAEHLKPTIMLQLNEETIKEYLVIQRLIASFPLRGHLAATLDPLGIVRAEHLKPTIMLQLNEETIKEYLVIQRLIASFRLRGHLAATLDPLGIVRAEHLKPTIMLQLNEETIKEYLVIQRLIASFRLRGHLAATLDPLGIVRAEHLKPTIMLQLNEETIKEYLVIQRLIASFRLRGHLAATLDPLGIVRAEHLKPTIMLQLNEETIKEYLVIQRLIASFRLRGHLAATLDPLGIVRAEHLKPTIMLQLNEETIKEYLVIQRLIASFRLRGHLAATLDPLGIVRAEHLKPTIMLQLNEETIKEYLVIQRLIASFRLRGHLAATLDPLGIVRAEHLKPTIMLQLNEETIKEYLVIQRLIASFRLRGHLAATLDPLGIVRAKHLKRDLIQKHILRHHFYNLPKDRMKMFMIHDTDYISGGEKYLSLDEIIKRLEKAYCGNIGIEYMYVQEQEKLDFIRYKFETPGISRMSGPEEKKLILKRLSRAHYFEDFLSKKYPSEKRFGLEGGEVLIPAVKTLVDTASALGADAFNIGIAHRGRLNFLANVLRKPLGDIFAQFKGVEFGEIGSGDVKYHLGTSVERVNSQTKRPIVISMLANPSHLECVNPIVIGKTYADRMERKDASGDKVWSILVHGDAATTGQGVVYETFHLSELPCFTNYGSIHIIINNQIGFTTDPRFARSSEYCTEVAKVSSAPVFHVNGDDPESTCYVMKVAAEFKTKFKSDVVIDIWCYRRHGHSEADQPKFTQPLMYKVIDKLKPVAKLYAEKLVSEGVVTEEDVQYFKKHSTDWYAEGIKDADKISRSKKRDWLDSPWKRFFTPEKDLFAVPTTGAKKEVLLKVGEAMSKAPEKFEMHPQLLRILQQRKDMIKNNQVDWALGEGMAIGSLLEAGKNVRLVGQDVERGTFSHRHHVYHHQSEDKVTYKPLSHVFPGGGKYKICNSSLSEFGVLGFQLGYSQVCPHNLVIWEAQFGDFVNSAQIIIDQFMASGESKWGRQISLVVLLPHGLEGQGPEHSSAWPERFLQMCAEPEPYVDDMPRQLVEANWFLANPSTPANYFHVLRRQLYLNFRKPLVIFSPKSILRHPAARSSLEEMSDGTMFKPYLKDDTITDVTSVERVLVCTGKIYYELQDQRQKRDMASKVALCRMEQLFPFPYGEVGENLKQYSNAQICWAQEEHKNHGWWGFIQSRLATAVGKEIHYIGRPPSASPSTGNKIQHIRELEELINQCFT